MFDRTIFLRMPICNEMSIFIEEERPCRIKVIKNNALEKESSEINGTLVAINGKNVEELPHMEIAAMIAELKSDVGMLAITYKPFQLNTSFTDRFNWNSHALWLNRQWQSIASDTPAMRSAVSSPKKTTTQLLKVTNVPVSECDSNVDGSTHIHSSGCSSGFFDGNLIDGHQAITASLQRIHLSCQNELVYQCFLTSFGETHVDSNRHPMTLMNRAIAAIMNHSLSVRTVLLRIYTDKILVINSKRSIIRQFNVNDIQFAVVSPESKQYMGIFAKPNAHHNAECHVYGIDEQLLFHCFHEKYTKRHGIKCTIFKVRRTGMPINACNEFPHSTTTVLRYLRHMKPSVIIFTPNQARVSHTDRRLRCTGGAAILDLREKKNSYNIHEDLSNPNPLFMSDILKRTKVEGQAQVAELKTGLKHNCSFGDDCGCNLLHSPTSTSIAFPLSTNLGEQCKSYDRRYSTRNGKIDNNDAPPLVLMDDSHLTHFKRPTAAKLMVGRCGTMNVSCTYQSYDAMNNQVEAGQSLPEEEYRIQQNYLSNRSSSIDEFSNCYKIIDRVTKNDVNSVESSVIDVKKAGGFPTASTHLNSKDSLNANLWTGAKLIDHRIPYNKQRVNDQCCDSSSTTTTSTVAVNDFEYHKAKRPLSVTNEQVIMGIDDDVQSSSQQSDRAAVGDIQRILQNEQYRKPFQKFLEQQFCAENINFYMAVEEYRSIPDEETERRAKVGRQIFDRHFTLNSVEPVNIDNSTNKTIKDAILGNRFTAHLYDVAQYQIFHLLKYDCWPRYLRSGGVAPSFEDNASEGNVASSSSANHSNQLREHPHTGDTMRSSVVEIAAKYCTLMHNDILSDEKIPLRDPKESVGKWTSVYAVRFSMDPRATEAVDAQTGSTIDPTRQAMDALNNRCVRLMPVLYFAVDIVIPNALPKTASSNSSRMILLRVRHGLSSSVVLKPVLAKFSVDFDSCVVVFSGTLDVIYSTTTVGNIGQRCVTVMTQQQYQDRLNSPKRESNRDCSISPHYLSAEINFPFYQHGDVGFVELPAEFDIRTGKMNSSRLHSSSKSDHGSGLLKFVRKASHAVTNRDSGDNAHPHPSTLHPSANDDRGSSFRRKFNQSFKRACVNTAAEIPYCGEIASPADEKQRAEKLSSESYNPVTSTRSDSRCKTYESSSPGKRDASMGQKESSSRSKPQHSNSSEAFICNVTKIPPIYTSVVPSEKDLSTYGTQRTIEWQQADYV